MPLDLTILLLAIVTGAAVQAGVGIGFSIVVAPIMMVMLGTATAVPVLLLLNTLVSLIATKREAWTQDWPLVRNAILGCFVGIAVGLLIYPALTERAVLLLTAGLLLLGLAVSMIQTSGEMSAAGFQGVAIASGLATVWAATPGPLMILGLLLSGHAPHRARELVQPIALIAYGTALALHSVANWQILALAPWLLPFLAATILGSLLGRRFGPSLPHSAITLSIRVISIAACLALFRRAFLVA